MGWTSYAKDRFFAPKISSLTACGARELRITVDESAQWLPTFVLTSVLQVNLADPVRQLIFSFLRRADAAVLEYGRARESLASYIETPPRSVGRYSRCLHTFEVAVAATFQGYQLASQLSGRSALYKKDDGSVLQRLERVYNATKHADDWIANGRRFAKDSTLPIWITNAGLEVRGYAITFDELAIEIEDLASFAVNLSSIRPDAPNA